MKTIESQAIKFGLITTTILIAYFLIMQAFGLVHNINLRFFNAIIMTGGEYFAINKYKNTSGKHFNYLEGIGVGVFTTLTVAITFCAFISLYIVAFPDFMAQIKAYEPQGIYLNPLAIGIIVFMEATASGFMISYISMQWLKKDRHLSVKNKKKTNKLLWN